MTILANSRFKQTFLWHRLTTLIIHHPHSFILGLKSSFSANASHSSLPFLLQDWLNGFPDCLPILLSWSIFLLFSYSFSTLLLLVLCGRLSRSCWPGRRRSIMADYCYHALCSPTYLLAVQDNKKCLACDNRKAVNVPYITRKTYVTADRKPPEKPRNRH